MKRRPLQPRSSTILYGVCGLALAASALGCDRGKLGLDMYYQPRHTPEQASDFFADGQSARPILANTVARTEVYRDRASQPGRDPSQAPPAEGFPAGFPTDGEALRKILERGQERYNIYCAVCHGYNGQGNGMIVQRGFTPPPSFAVVPSDEFKNPQRFQREQFLQTAPPSHVYNVITNGFGGMYSFGDRVAPEDRWAIAAYVKALQLVRPEPAAPKAPAGH